MSGTEYTFVIKTKLKPASAVVEANQAFRELLQTQKYPGALKFPIHLLLESRIAKAI